MTISAVRKVLHIGGKNKPLIEKQEKATPLNPGPVHLSTHSELEDKTNLTYAKMAKHIIYRILTADGVDLSKTDYEEAEKNDQYYIILILLNHKGFINHLSSKYDIPEFLLKYLLNMQFGFFKRNMQKPSNTIKANLFSDLIHTRLFEIKRQHDLIKRLCSEFNIEKRNLFDVGSQFCTSLLIALNLGFKVAHGCDFEKRITKYALEIIELGEKELKGELKFYATDFLELDLKENFYQLVLLINVLEHTSDIEKTILLIKKILADTGICFLFQGSFKSLPFVLNEPHYNLPLLTLLPNDLAVNILEKAKLLALGQRYCVVTWPDHYVLHKICARHDLILEIDTEEKGYYSRDKFIPYTQFETFKKRIISETGEKIYPLIEPDEQSRIEKILADYFIEVEQAIKEDTIEKRLIYFKRTWDMTIRKRCN